MREASPIEAAATKPAGSAGPRRAQPELDSAMTTAMLALTASSQRLCSLAGGADAARRMLAAIEPVWLPHGPIDVHVDLHRARSAKATIVFQPGSGAHARFYYLVGGLLAARGYHVLAIDRPGHGLSGGARGDCTIEEAVEVAGIVLEHARREHGLPVVLMGSSMGGLLTIFGLLSGLRPDLAVAHNFVYPGKLFSLRLRAWWIRRFRSRPYPLTELVHGLPSLSDDQAIRAYLVERSDPGAAWALSARSVASLFAFSRPTPDTAPDTLVLTGARDPAIPAWATRFFTWWCGLPRYQVQVVPDAGHLLFHDHLDVSVPMVTAWLDERLLAQRFSG